MRVGAAGEQGHGDDDTWRPRVTLFVLVSWRRGAPCCVGIYLDILPSNEAWIRHKTWLDPTIFVCYSLKNKRYYLFPLYEMTSARLLVLLQKWFQNTECARGLLFWQDNHACACCR